MKPLFLSALLLAAVAGCTSQSHTSSAAQKQPAEVFTDLVENYCLKFREHPQELEARLREDGFTDDKELEGTLVRFIDNIDYAITVEQHTCTTDVLLKHETGLLFDLNQIQQSLTSRLGISAYSSEFATEPARTDRETRVIKRKYRDEKGRKFELAFPTNYQDEYYMTFDVLLQ